MRRRLPKLKASLLKRLLRLSNFFAGRRLAKRHEVIAFQREGMPHQATEPSITVILNTYNRPEYLHKQLAALREQTVPATQIWIWCNSGSKALYDFSTLCDRVVVSNFNWKFFGRFSLGMLARTRYVAFIDDDILPGRRWFENCVHTIENGCDGILGGIGLILPRGGDYSGGAWLGWRQPHFDQPREVDLVGQSWFLRKQHLQYMWREEPFSWENGEDIHLSYMALKYGKVKSYVPPHPRGKLEWWSSDPMYSRTRGGDQQAHSSVHRKVHDQTRNDIVNSYRKNGWVIYNERYPVKDS